MTDNLQSVFVFPGQGSQKVGMLKELSEHWPEILETFAEASDVLGYDLWSLVQKGPQDELNLTACAQPALLCSSVAIWRVLQNSGSLKPALLAGHSLGEWSALVCAGVLSFKDAIRLVQLRGKYMQEAVPAGVGAMAAIIGLSDESIVDCCNRASSDEEVTAVNYNSPGQVVIAGHSQAVAKAIELCKEAGAKRAMPLAVSAPFHTELMRPAAERLADHIAQTEFLVPQIPVVHNVNAATESDPQKIKNLMVEQIFSPVPWVECVNTICDQGVALQIECGPGKVLSGLAKRINKQLMAQATDSVAAVEALLEPVS